MATSNNLRITLIATGTEAGTWGTTTNTNLGTIIEDSIAGYVTVSVTSASQALSALDGAADEARNAMIRLTTTTTAAFAVYAPPVSKQYIIWNNSGYAATIYNSTVLGNTTAAGAGVTIANGNRVVIFSNGTDFYEVQSGNVTGTVAIANGGTGQTTANAAFNALAPSQSGQNGRYLKSDGTNASWDAIDISTADITGVLLPANGGTGVNNGSFTATLGGNLSTGGTLSTTGAFSTSGAFSTTGAFSTAGAFTTVGANALTLTTTGATNVTFPVTGTLATRAGSETLTNKTINGPDNTLTNIANSSLANSSVTFNGVTVALGGSGTITPSTLTIGTGLSGGSYNGSSAVTIAIDNTVATLAGAQTLTNKTINGPDNSLTNIANASLANSSITINGNAVSLGGSTTVTATATNALTIGTGLSGGSYNGSSAVTIALAAGYGDTLNPYASKTANFFLAAPNGSAGVPTFRAIAAADIPTLNQNTTGTAAGLSATLAIASGGTGATDAAGARTNLDVPSRTGSGASGSWTGITVKSFIGGVDGVFSNGESNSVNVGFGNSTNGLQLWVNRQSSLGFPNEFRNFVVGDGKGAVAAEFTGSSKALNVVGTITQNTVPVVTTTGTQTLTNKTLGSGLVMGASTITPSIPQSLTGPDVSYTTIPSWVRRITLAVVEASTSLGTQILVQLGSGGSYTTSGYVESVSVASAQTNTVQSVSSAAGCIIYSGSAPERTQIQMVFTLLTGNTWLATHSGSRSGWGLVGSAHISLPGVLDRLRLIPTSGSDAFDGGVVNIFYE